jgi:hypothetical protein
MHQMLACALKNQGQRGKQPEGNAHVGGQQRGAARRNAKRTRTEANQQNREDQRGLGHCMHLSGQGLRAAYTPSSPW